MNQLRSAWVFDDGGRAAAGFHGSTGDCVVRSCAIAMQRPYGEVYAEIADLMARMPKTKRRKDAGRRSARNGVYTKSKLFVDWMETQGWRWTPTMRIGSGCTVHVRPDQLPSGRLIVAVSKHYTTLIDGVIHDTHDPSRRGERCVYGFWHQDPTAKQGGGP